MEKKIIKEIQKKEAIFFDNVAKLRTTIVNVPVEADYTNAKKFIPKKNQRVPLVDPKLTKILEGKYVQKYLDLVAHKKNGRVLDICCGSGWLALELARRGQIVDAYDLSPEAIKLAKKTLKDCKKEKGFGQINYHLADVSEVDLGSNKYDSISGWSAFHHLPDPNDFILRAIKSLKTNGIIATSDDLDMGKIEKFLELACRFVLPQIHHSYIDKLFFLKKLILRKEKIPEEVFSPMEEAKHCSVQEIESVLRNNLNIVYFKQFNAFVGAPVMTMAGNDFFRYSMARLLVIIDNFLCKIKLTRGFVQIIIARKN